MSLLGAGIEVCASLHSGELRFSSWLWRVCPCFQSPYHLNMVQPWEASRTSDCSMEPLLIPHLTYAGFWKRCWLAGTAQSPLLVNTLSHALCCLLPTGNISEVEVWVNGALELFVWFPLYYDCSPFYKYYLNIMMRSKNKTKYWKMKAENPSSILLSPGAKEQNSSGFV